MDKKSMNFFREDGKVRMDLFPSVETVRAVVGDDHLQLVRRMGALHLMVDAALEELKVIDPDSARELGKIAKETMGDVVGIFKGKGPRNFKKVGRSLLGLGAASWREGNKARKKLSRDLRFLLGRKSEYRGALLGEVSLVDPIASNNDSGQVERVGSAVLIFTDDDGKTHSCSISKSPSAKELVTGPDIVDTEVPTSSKFKAFVRHNYRGFVGVAERKNVFTIDAPRKAGLSIGAIFKRAIALYRESC